MGQASSGSICNSCEQDITAVCVSVLDPEAYATDAPSLSWRGMWAYAFPPFPSDSSLSQGNSGRMFSVPHCSSLGGASIVPSISVTSGNSSFEEGSAVPAFFQNIVSSPPPKGIPYSSLAAMQLHMQATGIYENLFGEKTFHKQSVRLKVEILGGLVQQKENESLQSFWEYIWKLYNFFIHSEFFCSHS